MQAKVTYITQKIENIHVYYVTENFRQLHYIDVVEYYWFYL